MFKFNHQIDPETGLIVKLDRRQLVYSPDEWYEMDFGGTRWRVDNLLPEVGTSLVAAGPKTGKGTFCRQMALAVAEGAPFLGRATKQGRVLYASRQEKMNELRSLFLQANQRKKPNVFLSPLEALQSTNAADAVRELHDLASDGEPVKLIILDMLESFFPSAGGEYDEKFDDLEPLGALAVELDCHICVIHHANKQASVFSMGVRSVLGSGAIAGSVDQVIILGENTKTGKRAICTAQRFGNGMERHWLDFDPDTRTYSLGKKLRVRTEQTEHSGAEHSGQDDRLYDYICDHPGNTLNFLRTKLGWQYQQTKDAIDRLIARGDIEPAPRTGTGNKGGGTGYWPTEDSGSGSDTAAAGLNKDG